jgi:hypothetical protein
MFLWEFRVDPKIIAVIIGVIGALLGVYLKEYVQLQIQKRRSITILRSNLFLFLEKVQSNEHLGKLLMAGTILDDRYIKSLRSGDDSKYKELLSQIDSIADVAKTDEILTDDDIDELCKKIKSFSRKEIEIVFDEIDRIREDVDHGTYILGNSDIKTLDANMVHRVLQVKRSINDIFSTVKIVLAGVYERDEIDREYVKSQAFGAVKEAILACRHVMPLLKMCNDKL